MAHWLSSALGWLLAVRESNSRPPKEAPETHAPSVSQVVPAMLHPLPPLLLSIHRTRNVRTHHPRPMTRQFPITPLTQPLPDLRLPLFDFLPELLNHWIFQRNNHPNRQSHRRRDTCCVGKERFLARPHIKRLRHPVLLRIHHRFPRKQRLIQQMHYGRTAAPSATLRLSIHSTQQPFINPYRNHWHNYNVFGCSVRVNYNVILG